MKTVTQPEFEAYMAQFSTTTENETDQGYLYENYTDAATGQTLGFVAYNAWRDPEYSILERQFKVVAGDRVEAFETIEDALELAGDQARTTGIVVTILDMIGGLTRTVGPDGHLSKWVSDPAQKADS